MSSSASAPENANDGCVGPASQDAGKSSACAGCPNQATCASGAFNSPEAVAKKQHDASVLQNALSNVSHVVLVLSGKGGVGGSSVCQGQGNRKQGEELDWPWCRGRGVCLSTQPAGVIFT